MSRRSHRHGERGHGRGPRPDVARSAPAAAPPTPAEAIGTPERPASVVTARLIQPAPDLAATPAGPTAGAADADREPRDGVDAPRAVSAMSPPEAPRPFAGDPGQAIPAAGQGTASGQQIAMAMPPEVGRGEAVDGRPILDGPSPGDAARSAGCTSPQLRRFIKSRAYIPMHELRRRFAINGPEDDVAAIDVDGTRLYVGLPEREGRLLGELLRAGDVGAELSHDPVTPIIVGVYPMRPVPRS